MYPSDITPESQEQLDTSLVPDRSTPSNAIDLPELSLPQGGGALRSIDEQFTTNPATGTASLSIPLPLSSGRQEFTPKLSLTYNSGSGNSTFGLGWSLSLSSIKQQTRQFIPRYDTPLKESVFLFDGLEIVPQLRRENGQWILHQHRHEGCTITRFRPRTEGDFARIEHLQHPERGTYWKITSPDNSATFYGYRPQARLADPKDERRVFEWFPEWSYDARGNWIHYHYKPEDTTNLPTTAHNQHRLNGSAPFANTYLKSVTYANTIPYYPNTSQPYQVHFPAANSPYCFELVLDYGEHDAQQPTPAEVLEWTHRPDAFSSHRAGFEIRTQRLCRRVLLFHHFENEQQFANTPQAENFGHNYLVQALHLQYKASNEGDYCEASFLHQVEKRGFIRRPDGTYSHQSTPPIELEYAPLQWNTEVQTVQSNGQASPHIQLDQQWVDWHNEGLQGLLSERHEGWYYQRNLGPDASGRLTLAEPSAVLSKPSFLGLSHAPLSVQDLEANGSKQIVVDSQGLHGYFDWKGAATWEGFQAFQQVPNEARRHTYLRKLDLTGNGQPDLVLTEEGAFLWYASAGKSGYQAAERTPKPWDEEQGPAIVFADEEEAIFLADMTGDGLTDLVRIRHHSVCYWANQGYGRFSAKVAMSNAPLIDHPDQFNPQRLHLADVSGTGAVDLIYLRADRAVAYLNYSGNAWSRDQDLGPSLPLGQEQVRFSVTDLLGTGTACLIWSSTLPHQSQAPLQYIDLMGSQKPYLLTRYHNHQGASTTLVYESSTTAYLRDQHNGQPWPTKLPFPVQVLRQIVVEEALSQRRLTTDYRYHYGYYDHSERLFRGFGLVEQWDTETHETWQYNNANNALTKESSLFQAPTLTRSWYHTGYYEEQAAVLERYQNDCWFQRYQNAFPEEPLSLIEPSLLEQQWLNSADFSPEEWKEAHHACRGQLLRQELFALDGNPDDLASLKREHCPYQVQINGYQIQRLQPKGEGAHASFLVTVREQLQLQYERDPADPRRSHTLTLAVNERGQILEQASIVYGRAAAAAQAQAQTLQNQVTDFSEEVLIGNNAEQQRLQNAFENAVQRTQQAQTTTHVLYTQNTYATAASGLDVDLPHAYRLRLPAASSTYELTGFPSTGNWYTTAELAQPLAQSQPLAYQATATNGPQHRLVERLEHEYWSEQLQPLPFGQYDRLGLTYQNYQLAYTPDLLETLYTNQGTLLMAKGETAVELLASEGQYSLRNGQWWIRSGITHLKHNEAEALEAVQNRFYHPVRYEDAQGLITHVTYDTYFLLLKSVDDPTGNRVQALTLDYRTLQPSRLADANANPSSVLLDELGRVKAVAIEGNGTYTNADRDAVNLHSTADQLDGLRPYWTPEEEQHWQAMHQAATPEGVDQVALEQAARALLQGASNYYGYAALAFHQQGTPIHTIHISRTQHHADAPNAPLQLSITYLDGMGETLLTKVAAEPGKARYINAQQQVQEKDTGTAWRWIGNGRTIYNNKNNPVQQYEPYFSTTFQYETLPALVQVGVTATLYYDALGRTVRTVLPNQTLMRVVHTPWYVEHWDPSDTVLESAWYTQRAQRQIDAQLQAEGKNPVAEQIAAQQSAQHAETPQQTYLDSLGRSVLTLEDNGLDTQQQRRWTATFVVLDVEGNTLSLIDARGNTAASYSYNLIGHRVVSHLNASGTRWVLNDVGGLPLYAWDERQHVQHYEYDAFQRPIALRITNGDGNQPLDHTYERLEYGDQQPNAELFNLRGQLFRHLDTAGELRYEQYDFKGNSLRSTRQFLSNYRDTPNWSTLPADQASLLDGALGTFVNTTSYDALSRPIQNTQADGSSMRPTYSVRGLLQSLQVQTPNTAAQNAIKRLTYDEKGQRQQVQYGDAQGNILSTTQYTYDRETFQLQRLRTLRGGEALQDLAYTYDPMGHLTYLRDRAIPTEYYNNQRIEGVATYQYDARQRLVAATGREHAGQAVNFGLCDQWKDAAFVQQYQVGDALAWRNYQQTYQYDIVGNILQQKHQAPNGNWTRDYQYEAATNRLAETRIGGQTYAYQHHLKHGFMTAQPHLSKMDWNFQDRLQATATTIQCNDNADVATTYYVYNSMGQRVRKINTDANGNKTDERLYLGSLEVYRVHRGANKGLIRYSVQVSNGPHRILQIDHRNAIDDGTDVETWRFQLTNHTRSVALELNQDGQLISYEEYHPYGTTAYQANNAAIRAAAKRYRYSGQERDEETGFSYHAARYYLPWLGRWLSSDPIGLEAGINTYAYVRGNPIGLVDPSGTEDEEPQPNNPPAPEPEPAPRSSFSIPTSGSLSFGVNLRLRLEESSQVTLSKELNLQDPQLGRRVNINNNRSLNLDFFPNRPYGFSIGLVRTTGTFFNSTGLGSEVGNNIPYFTNSTTYTGTLGIGPSVTTPLRFSLFDGNVTIEDSTSNAVTLVYGQATYQHGLLSRYRLFGGKQDQSIGHVGLRIGWNQGFINSFLFGTYNDVFGQKGTDHLWTAGATLGLGFSNGMAWYLSYMSFTGKLPNRDDRFYQGCPNTGGDGCYVQPSSESILNRSEWSLRSNYNGFNFGLTLLLDRRFNGQHIVHDSFIARTAAEFLYQHETINHYGFLFNFGGIF